LWKSLPAAPIIITFFFMENIIVRLILKNPQI